MKRSLLRRISRLPWWIKNPFIVTAALFLVWMIFLDENNFIGQYNKRKQLSELQQKQQFYKTEIERVKNQLSELTTNPASQEKFAREHYWMKRDNEEVFVIVRKPNQKNEE